MKTKWIILFLVLMPCLANAAGQWGEPGSNPVRQNYHPDGTTITAATDGTLTATAGAGSSVAITGGTINGTTIGVTTPAAGKFSTLQATGNVTLSPTGSGTVAISPAGALTINPTAASTINNTSIGATTAATGRFTTVQSTIATGTPPFTVASTTNVANLNASTVLGQSLVAVNAEHHYYVDANRVDTYTADGSQSKPYLTIAAALTTINADAAAHALAGHYELTNYVISVAPGTYSDALTFNNEKYLRIEGRGVFITGTIALAQTQQTGDYYSRVEFVGTSGTRAEKGPALKLAGDITMTRNNDSLTYVDFKGCWITGNILADTDGTWVTHFEGCRVAGTIDTGTFATGDSALLIETTGWNEFAGAITDKVSFYTVDNAEFYGAINITPIFDSRMTNCRFSSSVSIVASKNLDLDAVSYKALQARSPTLTGMTLRNLQGSMAIQDAGTVAITGGTVNNTTIGASTATTGRFTTIESTATTGTAPLIIASTTNVANLNASSLNGATFAAPGAIGGTTPAAATFTTAKITGTKVTTIAPAAASLLTNGAMTTDLTGWSGANWAWNAANGGEALHTAGATTALSSADNVVSGQSYLVTYTVHYGAAGDVTMSVGGLTDAARSTSNTFTYYGTATATTPIAFTPSNDFDGAVTLVSVQAMGPALTSCGTGPTLTRGSSSIAGTVVMGSGSPTACTLTYATAFTGTPACSITPTYNATAYLSAQSNSAFTATFSAGNATSGFNYSCVGLNE